MATITGYTAARMKAIEDACIIQGGVVLNNLILTKRDGSTVDAGNVRGPQGSTGPTGPQGPTGATGGVPTLVNALPSTPTEGQEIYFQTAAMEAKGVIWRLRYRGLNRDNSVNSSPYKWEAVGQPPSLLHAIPGRESTSVSAYGDLTTVGPFITPPLLGEYNATITARIGVQQNGGAGNAVVNANNVDLDPTLASIEWYENIGTSITEASPQLSMADVQVTVTNLAYPVKLRYRITGSAGAAFFERRRLGLAPVRVG